MGRLFLSYPGGSSVVTRVLIKRKQEVQNQSRRCDVGSRAQREWERERFENVTLLDLKMVVAAITKEIGWPMWAGKVWEMEPPEGIQPFLYLNFRTTDDRFLLFWATKFAVTYYSSNRNLIHLSFQFFICHSENSPTFQNRLFNYLLVISTWILYQHLKFN